MLYHYKKIVACTMVFGCIAVCSYAQEEMYHGGYDDGFAKGVHYNFSPSALAAQSMYKGGDGDGYAMTDVNQFTPGMLAHFMPYTSSMENDGYAGQLAIGQVLPIQLLSFTGMAVNKTGHLMWKVANENDIVRYELERSQSSIDFETIYSKPVSVPASVETREEYVDVRPFTGKNFYRLKIYGPDGEVKYSNIVLLVFNGDKAPITVYPNPAKDFITITSSGKIQLIELFDINGRKVKSFTASSSNERYSLAGIKAGMYVLRIQTEDEITNVKVIVH